MQLVALRVQDLENLHALCQQGQVDCDGDSTEGLVILGEWARGMRAVLDEAWAKHRIRLPQDMNASNKLKRSCYSNAEQCKEKNTTTDWRTLYPLPEALEKPADWDYMDASDDEVDDEEEESFRLTPIMAEHLASTLQVLGDDFHSLSARLPEVAKGYAGIEAWCKNLQECAFRMAARLEKGLQPREKLTRCTGEDFVLQSLVTRFGDYGLQELILDYDGDLPKCKYDLSLEDLIYRFTDDDKVMNLYWQDSDPSMVINSASAVYLHPAEWFKPFTYNYGEEAEIVSFMDHVHTDRTTLEERGAEVLQQSELLQRQLSPDVVPSFISSVLRHLTDVDLLRLGLCRRN